MPAPNLALVSELPRERCLSHGPSVLSLQECLALLLGTGPPGVGGRGLASRVLNRAGSGLPPSEQERAFFTALESEGGAHLEDVAGLGPAGRARLLAAWEVGRRYAHYRTRWRLEELAPRGASPLAALRRIPPEARLSAQEWLGFIAVYRSGELGNLCVVERGARTHVNTDATEFFARLLALRPAAFFLAHNHPSGRLMPSPEDLQLTETLAQMAQPFAIPLRGHWIVSADGEHWIKPPAL
jgi:DNA repair protein RadC